MKKLITLLLVLAVLALGCKKETGDKGKLSLNGTVYSTVIIGKQEWTTVNYNGPGGVEGKYYVTSDNFKKYYSVEEANGIKLSGGWRVPTKNDFDKLISQFSNTKDKKGNAIADFNVAKMLMSVDTWDSPYAEYQHGTNSSGFNAYPAGFYIANTSFNQWVTINAFFLTSTPLSAADANPHATHYSFIITNLVVNMSVDNDTACFTCFAGPQNVNAPKSLRFVRDL